MVGPGARGLWQPGTGGGRVGEVDGAWGDFGLRSTRV